MIEAGATREEVFARQRERDSADLLRGGDGVSTMTQRTSAAEIARRRRAARRSAGEPSEEELRAAYEAELSRITPTDMMLQAAVSLLNIGARRLGPPRPGRARRGRGHRRPSAGRRARSRAGARRDRRRQGAAGRSSSAGSHRSCGRCATRSRSCRWPTRARLQAARRRGRAARARRGAGGRSSRAGEQQGSAAERSSSPGPGPAQASGRLWVPGQLRLCEPARRLPAPARPAR